MCRRTGDVIIPLLDVLLISCLAATMNETLFYRSGDVCRVIAPPSSHYWLCMPFSLKFIELIEDEFNRDQQNSKNWKS